MTGILKLSLHITIKCCTQLRGVPSLSASYPKCSGFKYGLREMFSWLRSLQ